MHANRHRHFFVPGKTVCDICDAPLTSSDFVNQKGADQLVCTSAMCRQVILDGRKMAPPLAERHIARLKGRLRQQREDKLAQDAYIKKVLEKEDGQNRAIFAAVTASRPGYSAENLFVLPIPSGGTVVTDPGREKLASYEANLRDLVRTAFAADPDDDGQSGDEEGETPSGWKAIAENTASENPIYENINSKVCGICKGGCCASGGNHAYIEVRTILRVRKQHPDWSEEDVLHEYISRVGDESVDGACINQTVTGCVLPVALRSDICNSFFCSSMRSLHEHLQRKGEKTAILAIQRSNSNFNAFDPDFDNEVLRVVLIDGDESEEIDGGLPGTLSTR